MSKKKKKEKVEKEFTPKSPEEVRKIAKSLGMRFKHKDVFKAVEGTRNVDTRG